MSGTEDSIPPHAVTMGEPAGVGADITFAAWHSRTERKISPFFLIDDPARLAERAKTLGLEIPLHEIAIPSDALSCFGTALPVLPHPLVEPAPPGEPKGANAEVVLHSIRRAVAYAEAGDAASVVTNPIHKGVLMNAGFAHPGHTEYLAALSHVPRTVMMLASEFLRVVPVTIHLPLRDAIDALTSDLIVETAEIVEAALRRDFGIAAPRLAISGLNPHAGEDGKLGKEDGAIIAPAVDRLKASGIDAVGPLPGDTMFHEEARAKYDVALCMYHDQALIPIKTLDFHGGVNITLGLPYIRTSPDHGTAFALAGTGKARPDSLIAAIAQADRMARQRRKSA